MSKNTLTARIGPVRRAIALVSLAVTGSAVLVVPMNATLVAASSSQSVAGTTATTTKSATTTKTATTQFVPSQARLDRKNPSSRGLPRAGGPAASQRYARAYIAQRYGWGSGQFSCLKVMWTRESAWKYWVSNPNGKYHGIPQTSWREWSKSGYSTSQYMNSPEIQIQVGARYIKSRYGSPCAAWAFWQNHHWY